MLNYILTGVESANKPKPPENAEKREEIGMVQINIAPPFPGSMIPIITDSVADNKKPSFYGGKYDMHDIGADYTGRTFGLRITTNTHEEFQENDILILQQIDIAMPGDVVALQIEDYFTIKRFIKSNGVGVLRSITGKYADIEIHDRMFLLGKVIKIERKFYNEK